MEAHDRGPALSYTHLLQHIPHLILIRINIILFSLINPLYTLQSSYNYSDNRRLHQYHCFWDFPIHLSSTAAYGLTYYWSSQPAYTAVHVPQTKGTTSNSILIPTTQF